MECAEAREHLTDLHRERLEAELARVVRAHVDACDACGAALRTEAQVRALIQSQAPRYRAPSGLRVRIQASLAERAPTGWSGWRGWLRAHPWMVGGLVGAAAVVLLAWAGTRWLSQDPVSRLVARAVTEHEEYLKGLKDQPTPDPVKQMDDLRSRVDFAFEPVFRGDAQVQMVAALVSDLPGKRAATFVYRDRAGRYTTLFLMPEAGTPIPAEDRLPIETFKPHHRVAAGRHLLLWKQRDLAWLLVSDLGEAELPAMFLKIRKAT